MQVDDAALLRLAARVGRHLRDLGWVLSTAESCTGGWICKSLTDIPGSSDWFGEGFVTYSNRAKRGSLGVPSRMLAAHGAVSGPVVRAMAAGALRRSGSDVAVAVSGIAGPGGAVPGKPVGTVWLCWAWRKPGGVRYAAERRRFRGDREAVRRKTVAAALRGVLAR